MNLPKPETVKSQSIFESQLDQIESRLKNLDGLGERIGHATNRLLNPRPMDACKGEAGVPPSPSTVEGRLQNILRHLDVLQGNFEGHAQTLDQAI